VKKVVVLSQAGRAKLRIAKRVKGETQDRLDLRKGRTSSRKKKKPVARPIEGNGKGRKTRAASNSALYLKK